MASLAPNSQLKKHKVSVIGSGNWGSTIAKIVAENVIAHPNIFEKEVRMWVFEEEVKLADTSKKYDSSSEMCTKPQKLTTLINHFHENVKYLPDIALPPNILACPSLPESVEGSTILIFNLPHQFIAKTCSTLRGHIVPFARGISCVKGVDVQDDTINLFSEKIGAELGIYCGALSGANIANEVAQEKFSETTIAYDPPPMDSQAPTPVQSGPPSPSSSNVDLTQLIHKDASGKASKVKLRPLPSEYHPFDHSTVKLLFHRPYFHVRVVSDVAGTSLGGALKNIVALAAGFVDGLGWGDNAKAAIMRVGLLEMVKFGTRFFEQTIQPGTFTEESAGVADLITTCSGGRNHRCAKLSVQRGVSIDEVEASELNGQKLQGTLTAKEVNSFLKAKGMEKEFPLFTAVWDILQGKADVKKLPELIEPSSEDRDEEERYAQNHPVSKEKSADPNHRTLLGHRTIASGKLPFLPRPAPLLDEDTGQGSDSNHSKGGHAEDDATTGIKRLRQQRGGNHPASQEKPPGREHGTLLAARYAVCDASSAWGVPVVWGAAQGVEGMEAVFGWNASPPKDAESTDKLVNGEEKEEVEEEEDSKWPCYRCIFPTPPDPRTVHGCNEIGILGPTVGTIGVMMAGEAIKILVKSDRPNQSLLHPHQHQQQRTKRGGKASGFHPQMTIFQPWAPQTMWRSVKLRNRRAEGCEGCSFRTPRAREERRKLLGEGGRDYVAFCGVESEERILGEGERVEGREFLRVRMEEEEEGKGNGERMVVVDVREKPEFEMGPTVRGSVNVPVSSIRVGRGDGDGDCEGMPEGLREVFERKDTGASVDADGEGERKKTIYMICQQGNDSQVAVERVREWAKRVGRRVVDVRGGVEGVVRAEGEKVGKE
ncbi:MAG: hypothetical protein Q9227_007946 [Pyrenula ochraceoflavens]